MECRGDHVQPFLNHLVRDQIELLDVQRDSSIIHLTIHVRDFRRFTKLVRKYRLRMRIIEKSSGLFFWIQAQKRKFFILGIILFFMFLIGMSSFIWRVDIKGNETIPDEVISSHLAREGVFVGQLKYKIPEQDAIQHKLLAKLPDASWIGYRIEGTRVVIMIVEKKKEEIPQEEIPSQGPVHLIARKQAMIYDMKVLQGNPLVEVSDVVKKGQRLVSGFYGEDDAKNKDVKDAKNEYKKIVGARGKILGEVWYEMNISTPLKQEKQTLTGQTKRIYYPYVGSFILRWDFWRKPSFHQFVKMNHVHPLFLFGVRLPLGMIQENELETRTLHQEMSLSQATFQAREQARNECLKAIGKDGKIITEKVLHRSVENGKVVLKLHFDVIENIAIPQPILQGE